MSHDHGYDTLFNRLHDQSERSHCKTLLRNASVCCNGCGWLHKRCSVLKRSTDRPHGFQCPRCVSKVTHGDLNVPTTALPTDLNTQGQDHTTSLPQQEAHVADDANDRPIAATAPQDIAGKKENIYKMLRHKLPGNAEKIDRIQKEIYHWWANFIMLSKKRSSAKIR